MMPWFVGSAGTDCALHQPRKRGYPAIRNQDSLGSISFAYAGLITSLINANRSSNGMNALFMALTVNHCNSAQPYPKASASSTISRDIDVPLINRLSVL